MSKPEAWAITVAIAVGILALGRGPLRLALLALLAIGTLGAYVLMRVIVAS